MVVVPAGVHLSRLADVGAWRCPVRTVACALDDGAGTGWQCVEQNEWLPLGFSRGFVFDSRHREH
jgi:hypothetical protein